MLIRDGESCVEFARCPSNTPYEGKTDTITLFVRVSSQFLHWEARGVRFARQEFRTFVACLAGPIPPPRPVSLPSAPEEFGPRFSLTIERAEELGRLRVRGEISQDYALLGVFFEGLLRFEFTVDEQVAPQAARGLEFVR